MIRKLTLSLTAAAALAAAALAPTAASAGWKHHHGHYGLYGAGIGLATGLAIAGAYNGYGYYRDCYWTKRWVETPYGPRYRTVRVCG